MGTIRLKKEGLTKLRQMNPRMVSYNVEMAEVTGGTFWKEYTGQQVLGEEPYIASADAANALQVYDPVNLYEQNLRVLAKALGSSWVRVSGSWCTTTFVDLEGETCGTVPKGYQSVLTKEQWIGVLDFVRAVDGKLMISVANCEGNHSAHEPWNSEQAIKLLDFSSAYGVPVDAAEFTNEPNGYNMTGTPKGYTPQDFGRDQDLFFFLLSARYPGIIKVGPSACFDDIEDTAYHIFTKNKLFAAYPTQTLLEECQKKADAFSYHLYYGLSERGAAFGGHFDVSEVLTERYLKTIDTVIRYYEPLRERFMPGSEVWITEEGDAGCGGNTWASTFLEALRLADVFGRFARQTNGVLFHNTLAASAYGFLDQRTHLPRPSYWVAYLWKHLIGDIVYDAAEPIREGVHVFAHSRKDKEEGLAYVIVNNSRTQTLRVLLPGEAIVFSLCSDKPRSEHIYLNKKELVYTPGDKEPKLNGRVVGEGEWVIEPVSVTFLLV